MRHARFHVPEAAPGSRLELPDHAAHHARDVLRLRAGADVRVFDGIGNEFDASLTAVTRQSVRVELRGAVPASPESPLHVTLAVSALRGDRLEWVIQKSCELGVQAIVPLVCARTDAAARPVLDGSRQRRWNLVAGQASEQCGRAVVPAVRDGERLTDFLRVPPDGRRILLDGSKDATGGLGAAPADGRVVLLVGPPGGFDDHESGDARNCGFAPARLGPRILRTETAAVAAVALVQYLWGDAGARP